LYKDTGRAGTRLTNFMTYWNVVLKAKGGTKGGTNFTIKY